MTASSPMCRTTAARSAAGLDFRSLGVRLESPARQARARLVSESFVANVTPSRVTESLIWWSSPGFAFGFPAALCGLWHPQQVVSVLLSGPCGPCSRSVHAWWCCRDAMYFGKLYPKYQFRYAV